MVLESQQYIPHYGVFVTGYVSKLTGVVKNSLCSPVNLVNQSNSLSFLK